MPNNSRPYEQLTIEQWIEILDDTEITKPEFINILDNLRAFRGYFPPHLLVLDNYGRRIIEKYGSKFNIATMPIERISQKLFFDFDNWEGRLQWQLRRAIIQKMSRADLHNEVKKNINRADDFLLYDGELRQLSEREWIDILTNPKLRDEKMNDCLKFMYQNSYRTPNCSEIAESIGFSKHTPLMSFVANYAKRISNIIDINRKAREGLQYKYWSFFFLGKNYNGNFYWKLKPNLFSALECVDTNS